MASCCVSRRGRVRLAVVVPGDSPLRVDRLHGDELGRRQPVPVLAHEDARRTCCRHPGLALGGLVRGVDDGLALPAPRLPRNVRESGEHRGEPELVG
eukprot:9123572-Pyramimonas_sp.AAC.1